ncbi:lytic transglycosylase domain-containing protein [Ignatzschineria sp. LJL83]
MIKKQACDLKLKLGVSLCVLVSSVFSWSFSKSIDRVNPQEMLLSTKLSNGMQISDKNHARVKEMIHNFETKNSAIFTHLDENGLVVFNYVVKELERRNMPLEIAFVPLVESGYKPNARNGLHIGLWQLGKPTAETFGVRVTKESDGRLDLVRATEAALDYLEYLNKRFDGDWLLTLAAYNAGEGRVLRSMKKNRDAGKPDDYWNIELPEITRAYIPKVLALSELALEKEMFAVPVVEIPEIVAVKSNNKGKLLGSFKKQGIQKDTIDYFNPSDIYTRDGSSVIIMLKDIVSLADSTAYQF